MSDLNQAIAHYSTELVYSIPQPPQTNQRGIEWNKRIARDVKMFWSNRGYDEFLDFNVHMVKQNWGSTSAGWGGIGGAAMTETYTVVIHCFKLQIIAVYYQGQIAYVMDISGDHEDFGDFSRVPAFSDARKQPRVIYTNYKYDK